MLLMLAAAVTAAFEGGNAARLELLSDTHIRCVVNGEADSEGRNRQPSWFYFRLDGAPAAEIRIDITGLAGEYNYVKHDGRAFRNMRAVYSYDRKTWSHFEKGDWDQETSTVRLRFRPERSHVWIAKQAPYTNSDLAALIADVRKNRALRVSSVGKTVEGREMPMLTIGNGARVIWLMFRQHAWESGTSWTADGAIRYLLSADARDLRDAFTFKIFPMADPDGVARGGVRFNKNGFDLNRNWDTIDPARMPEIDAQHRAILGGRADFFLTMHNTESQDYVEGPPGPLGGRLWKQLDATAAFYSPKGVRVAAQTTTPGMKGRMSVNQALYHERKIPAFLMETMVDDNPKIGRPRGKEDWIKFGPELVRAIAAAL